MIQVTEIGLNAVGFDLESIQYFVRPLEIHGSKFGVLLTSFEPGAPSALLTSGHDDYAQALKSLKEGTAICGEQTIEGEELIQTAIRSGYIIVGKFQKSDSARS